MDNMHPVHANTADCAAYTPMMWGYMHILVHMVCFHWNICTNNIELQLHFTVLVEKPQKKQEKYKLLKK